jgi:hypothetical protein
LINFFDLPFGECLPHVVDIFTVGCRIDINRNAAGIWIIATETGFVQVWHSFAFAG